MNTAEANIDTGQTATRLMLATRAAGIGIWDYDLLRDVLDWDNQMFVLYGVDKAQFSGAYEAWKNGVHPEDRERADAEVQMALRGEKELSTDFRVIWPDGTEHVLGAIGTVLRDETGRPVRFLGMNWDITEERRRVAELKQTIEELQLLNRLTTNREIAMIELKQEVNELRARLGEPPKYDMEGLLPGAPDQDLTNPIGSRHTTPNENLPANPS